MNPEQEKEKIASIAHALMLLHKDLAKDSGISPELLCEAELCLAIARHAKLYGGPRTAERFGESALAMVKLAEEELGDAEKN